MEAQVHFIPALETNAHPITLFGTRVLYMDAAGRDVTEAPAGTYLPVCPSFSVGNCVGQIN